jgi:uncharacterized membrane protein YphA (DoxX/SURF4 family)
MNTVTSERLAILYARIALGAAFLSAVADRFGLWGKYGGWKNFATFTDYTAQVNSFMPAFIIPFLAWAATAAELALGIGLIIGFWPRWVASSAAILLFLFGTAMAISFGSNHRWTIPCFPHPQQPYCSRCTGAPIRSEFMNDFRGGNMRRVILNAVAIAGALAMLLVSGLAARPDDRAELMKAREAVWRAWFVNDTKALEAMVPPDTIVIGSGQERWRNQADILQSAARFQTSGGKLIRLEFPQTEIQRFGDVAIFYSKYLYETEEDGKRSVTTGRVTEIFVLRNGKWTNPGWHTDTER